MSVVGIYAGYDGRGCETIEVFISLLPENLCSSVEW